VTAPEVTVGFGEAFETILDQTKFKLKKGKWTFKDPKAEGVTKAVLDFGRGQAKITAKKATLGAFPQGATPLTILLEPLARRVYILEIRLRRGPAGEYRPAHAMVLSAF